MEDSMVDFGYLDATRDDYATVLDALHEVLGAVLYNSWL